MREILDTMAQSAATLDLQIDMCRFIVNWCKEQNKNFVRHKIEIRLGKLLYDKVKFYSKIGGKFNKMAINSYKNFYNKKFNKYEK